MSEFLVIRFGRDPDGPVRWVIADQTGAIVSRPAEGELVAAAAAAAGRAVIALVPATDVLRTRVDVPVKGAAKMLQALPFALEEQLAEDVDALHFAAGPRGAHGLVPVAVVRREILTAWLERLAAAGLQPQQLYAESDALGGIPNTTILLAEEDSAILAEPDGNVATIDSESIEELFDLWLTDAAAPGTEEDQPPRHLVAYCTAPLAHRLETLWERLRPELDSLDLRALGEGGAMPRLAAQIVTAPGVNLLQGDFAKRSSLMAYWPAWRAAAAIVAGFLVVYFSVQLAELRQLNARAAALDQTIDQAFHYVFPDAGEVQDPRAQLESRLRQLGSDSGGSREFLDSLKAVADAVGQGGQARIEALSYRSGVLDLRVRAPSVEALDQIQQSVAGSGRIQAEIQSANASGNEVLGRIQIKRAGG
jgi:general secretion pathway protein L